MMSLQRKIGKGHEMSEIKKITLLLICIILKLFRKIMNSFYPIFTIKLTSDFQNFFSLSVQGDYVYNFPHFGTIC